MAKNKEAKKAFLSTAEVAALAGIKVTTLHTYRKRGYGPLPVLPGSGVYRREDVETWLANRPGQGWRRGQRGKAAVR